MFFKNRGRVNIVYLLIITPIVLIIAGVIVFLLFQKEDLKYPPYEKYCSIPSDCVPVVCECECSGCGGFDYDDVVNKTMVDKWYQEHCPNDGRQCPQVCCKELTEIACENNTCVVETQVLTDNCNIYKMPMSVEEIQGCSCPSGYKKFRTYAGARCGTNSQKPCKSHSECPSEERCVSMNGKDWVCTGILGGCYAYDPENPEQQICVD